MAEAAKKAPTLSKKVFSVEVANHELLKLAYDAYLAQARLSSATTKKRGDVRGGGKKPWRQKGTGRARFGSSRNPIWRGGGVVFGPQGIENYTKKLSSQSKRLAVKQALSLAHKADKITIAEVKTTGKTREIAEFLKKQKADKVRRVLIVTDKKTPELIRATKNLSQVELLSGMYLSVYHILNADKIFIAPNAVEVIEAWLTKESK